MAGRHRKATYDIEELMIYDREKTLVLVSNLGGPKSHRHIMGDIEYWLNSMDYNAYKKVRNKIAKELKKVKTSPAGMTAEEDVIKLFEFLWDDDFPDSFYSLFGQLEMLGRDSLYSWRDRVISNIVRIRNFHPESYASVTKVAKKNRKKLELKKNNIISFPTQKTAN